MPDITLKDIKLRTEKVSQELWAHAQKQPDAKKTMLLAALDHMRAMTAICEEFAELLPEYQRIDQRNDTLLESHNRLIKIVDYATDAPKKFRAQKKLMESKMRQMRKELARLKERSNDSKGTA